MIGGIARRIRLVHRVLGTGPTMAFADYQNELYDQSLHGNQPQYPIRFEDLEKKAAAAMTPKVLQYVAGGAGDEHTQRANCAAFKRWGLYPRMGIAPEQRDMSVELFGMRFPSPIFMAPIGVIGVCDPNGHGDILCARAAVRTGVPFFVGTLKIGRASWWGILFL